MPSLPKSDEELLQIVEGNIIEFMEAHGRRYRALFIQTTEIESLDKLSKVVDSLFPSQRRFEVINDYFNRLTFRFSATERIGKEVNRLNGKLLYSLSDDKRQDLADAANEAFSRGAGDLAPDFPIITKDNIPVPETRELIPEEIEQRPTDFPILDEPFFTSRFTRDDIVSVKVARMWFDAIESEVNSLRRMGVRVDLR